MSAQAAMLWFLVVLLSAQYCLGCTEESCLVAIRPALKKDEPEEEDRFCMSTQEPGKVKPREEVKGNSAAKRWAESWALDSVNNAFKEFSALIMKVVVGGLLGDVFAAMIKAFWPSKFSPEKAIMKAMMEWTQDYVQMTFENQLKEDIAGKMCALKMQTNTVKMCTDSLVEEIKKMLKAGKWRKPDFPTTTLERCLTELGTAKKSAWDVAAMIDTSSHKAVLGAEFAAISWALMGIWRHNYYLRRVGEGHYDEFPDFAGLEKAQAPLSLLNTSGWGTSEGVRQEMGKDLKKLLGTAKAIKKDWEEWRFAKIELHGWDTLLQGYIKLTDQLTGTSQIFKTEKVREKETWQEKLAQPKWKDVILENYKKMLYIKEFVPMMRMMPFLSQLIPGREKDSPEPAPFDEFIKLPRLSAFLAGDGKPHMDKGAFESGKWMEAPRRTPDHGRITKISALGDDVLKQLTFINAHGQEVVLGTSQGVKLPTKDLPKKTCGLDLGYHDAWMRRITFLNAENEMAELKGKNHDETAIFFTGVGLCGLYTFDRPTDEAKDFGGTGDAFEVQFQWDPDIDDV